MSKIPSIDFIFKQLSTTIIDRSERGTAFLIVKDDTNASWTSKIYTDLTEIDESLFTENNLRAVKGALAYNPYEVIVVRTAAVTTTELSEGGEPTESTAISALNNALKTIMSIRKSGWIGIAGATPEENTALASWIKARTERGCTYKAIVYNTKADNKHIINFATEKVTIGKTEYDGSEYVPWILSLAAATNIKSSMTYKVCKDISDCSCLFEKELEDATEKGEMHITQVDNEFVIAVGINSLTTLDNVHTTEDMQFVETIETIDMIQDDIRAAFKKYIGNVKNTYINQMLFVSACNGYLRGLETDDNYTVLDPDYNNMSDINVTKQRSVIMVNKPEAESWTDAQVKHYPYKRIMYLKGDIKTTFCVHNLMFEVELAA